MALLLLLLVLLLVAICTGWLAACLPGWLALAGCTGWLGARCRSGCSSWASEEGGLRVDRAGRALVGRAVCALRCPSAGEAHGWAVLPRWWRKGLRLKERLPSAFR